MWSWTRFKIKNIEFIDEPIKILFNELIRFFVSYFEDAKESKYCIGFIIIKRYYIIYCLLLYI